MTSEPAVRILCVDDHRIVREGIALILSREPDITVVATAATVQEAVSEFKRHLPDVTLMDLRLGDSSGIDAIKVRSSMTLSTRADPSDQLFQAVLARFYSSEPDPATEGLLRS